MSLVIAIIADSQPLVETLAASKSDIAAGGFAVGFLIGLFLGAAFKQ